MLAYPGPKGLLLAKGQMLVCVDGVPVMRHISEHVVGMVVDGNKRYLPKEEVVFVSDGSPVYDEHGRPRRLLNGMCID